MMVKHMLRSKSQHDPTKILSQKNPKKKFPQQTETSFGHMEESIRTRRLKENKMFTEQTLTFVLPRTLSAAMPLFQTQLASSLNLICSRDSLRKNNRKFLQSYLVLWTSYWCSVSVLRNEVAFALCSNSISDREWLSFEVQKCTFGLTTMTSYFLIK